MADLGTLASQSIKVIDSVTISYGSKWKIAINLFN